MKNIVIVGATSLIAEQTARIWAQREKVNMTLIGRDEEKLKKMANDLTIRSPSSVFNILVTDFLDPVAIQSTVDQVTKQKIDIVLIAHGSLPNQVDCETNLEVCNQALTINAVSPVLFAEAFARYMATYNHGTLAIIGSVAGDRGRKSNYVYGAAKGLLARYAQGLQHRFAQTSVNIVLINPGPTDTPMTAHLKETGMKLASSESVAKQIVVAIDKKTRVCYVPKQWGLIMTIIRLLPAPIFNRLNI